MAFDTSWDVEKYHVPYESEEHWLLKKQFIEAHKEKYPEERLICLAQCFFNIEFMGTRYPDKVMKLVEELSVEVAAEHREKQKTKLQRTFVKASDAAEAKVKKSSKRPSDSNYPDSKRKKNEAPQFKQGSNQGHVSYSAEVVPPKPKGQFSHIILFQYGANTNPKAVIKTSLDKAKRSLDVDFKKENNMWVCTLKIDQNQLSVGKDAVKKDAETLAFQNGYARLLSECYSIQVTSKDIESVIKGNERVQKAEIVSEDGKHPDTKLAQDNVGMKLMKMMGWTGGGLGKNEQGIEEPVLVSTKVTRSGLGSLDSKMLMQKLKDLLDEFRSGDESIMAFSSDFLSEERAFIHQFARRHGFVSKSYGKNENRYITISKQSPSLKFNPWNIVKTLYALEGRESTLDSARNTFKLILPTSLNP
nr:PREDICTED: NF-kappa-B-repressing factor-like isoform X2 [Bemisia tabaci]XP_018902957.1 PREDICTED: NF-kappa-B-repressing factor-like isoform X2 [Bemisia tabaci]XP_018902966.1 PREDICTED: NF-kappa-B-repressing factor-like isoform X2 [Bemisia tabaci]